MLFLPLTFQVQLIKLLFSVGVAAQLNGCYLIFYADSASFIPKDFVGNTIVGVLINLYPIIYLPV
ncbi:MAG: hypothetical protein PUF31_01660 [Oscillospiraceae bacterium]|nr:hypothetical protein [Oscillospiraceae bacterium]